MDANELRALADALDDCDPPYYESSPQINRSLDACIAKAADYLRAQADAQPVAWIAHNLTTGHVKWTTDRCRARGWTRSVNLRVKPLYAHPAPAVPTGDYSANGEPLYTPPVAPQDEPIDPHMIVAEDRFPDVPAEQWVTCSQCGEDVDRECPICDGLGRVLATDSEQAEPKREPLSDEQIDAALQTDPAMILALMNGEMTVGEFKAALRRLARTVEHAHGISGGGHD